jgi:hypothetical protein
MNIYIFYVNHIAICMCNSLKCWFKHPLPYMILEVPWDDLWTLSFGYHNFMVTALGSCVKWP